MRELRRLGQTGEQIASKISRSMMSRRFSSRRRRFSRRNSAGEAATGAERSPLLATLSLVTELGIEVGLDSDVSSRGPADQAKNLEESDHAAQPIPPIGRPPHRPPDAVA